ncbi:hypothetical protein KC19_8G025500 [Ceratodon purpureus]|uniref:Uncharacterized protein n=1 Tax=Ceratodon purpureus TaxID=3225 RepID=A0A8T0H2N4_CERPU|nr:hypothetical protein KC19_8G025500 [Ceratodon purpureus]
MILEQECAVDTTGPGLTVMNRTLFRIWLLEYSENGWFCGDFRSHFFFDRALALVARWSAPA